MLMMNRFFALLAVAAILCGICTGRADALTNVVLEEGAGAIELCIYLTGGMCVWGGLLRIAQRSGLTDRLAACFANAAAAGLLFQRIHCRQTEGSSCVSQPQKVGGKIHGNGAIRACSRRKERKCS